MSEKDEVIKWIGDLICTAKDGGDAWCAVRKQPGAKEWAEKLTRVWKAIQKPCPCQRDCGARVKSRQRK